VFSKEKTKVFRKGNSLFVIRPRNIFDEVLVLSSLGTIEKFDVRREEEQRIKRVNR
jgi:hypothetical protein